jgi:hypothetical protein
MYLGFHVTRDVREGTRRSVGRGCGCGLAVVELADMHLYNLTLQPTTASPQAIVGNFSGARQQEIIISHGTRLQLIRPDVQTGKLSTIITTDVFGSIRSLAAFRLTGGTKGKPL